MKKKQSRIDNKLPGELIVCRVNVFCIYSSLIIQIVIKIDLMLSRLIYRVASVGTISSSQRIHHKFCTKNGPNNGSKTSKNNIKNMTTDTDSKSSSPNILTNNEKNMSLNNEQIDSITFKHESSGNKKESLKENEGKKNEGQNEILQVVKKKDGLIAKKDEKMYQLVDSIMRDKRKGKKWFTFPKVTSFIVITLMGFGLKYTYDQYKYFADQQQLSKKNKQKTEKKDKEETEKLIKQLNEFLEKYKRPFQISLEHVGNNSVQKHFKKIIQYLHKQAESFYKDRTSKIKTKFICGLPGTGKTTSLKKLAEQLRKQGKTVYYINFRPNDQQKPDPNKILQLMEDAQVLIKQVRWDQKSVHSIPFLIFDDINMIQLAYADKKHINADVAMTLYLLPFIARASIGAYVIAVSSSSQFIQTIRPMSPIQKTVDFDVCEPLQIQQRADIVHKFAEVHNLNIPKTVQDYLVDDPSIRNVAQNLKLIKQSNLLEDQIRKAIQMEEQKKVKIRKQIIKKYLNDFAGPNQVSKAPVEDKLQVALLQILLKVYDQNKNKKPNKIEMRGFGSTLQYVQSQVGKSLDEIQYKFGNLKRFDIQRIINFLNNKNILIYSQPRSRRELQAIKLILKQKKQEQFGKKLQ